MNKYLAFALYLVASILLVSLTLSLGPMPVADVPGLFWPPLAVLFVLKFYGMHQLLK